MLDDTCYFVACQSAQQAALVVTLLNHPMCRNFIQSIIFLDAKRPVTKKLLQRINLNALIDHVDRQPLLEDANSKLERLETFPHKNPTVWPENLKDLLENGFSGTKRSHQRKQPPALETFSGKKTANIFQMGFLEFLDLI